MIAHVPAVPAKARALTRRSHRLELSGTQSEIESSLLGGEEGASLLGPGSAGEIVIHKILIARSGGAVAHLRGNKWRLSPERQRLENACPRNRAMRGALAACPRLAIQKGWAPLTGTIFSKVFSTAAPKPERTGYLMLGRLWNGSIILGEQMPLERKEPAP